MEIRRLLVAAALLYTGCSAPQVPQKTAAPASDPVKITAFYPRDAIVTEGGKTVLCYGVTNAKSVHIDPPVEGVSPALSRCVEIRPRGETRYTLTAEGADGQLVTQSAVVHIGTDTSTLPRISSFQIDGKSKDYAGKAVYNLSFSDQNAEEVSIDPPVFPTLHGAPSGSFSVRPDKTTTYTLKVKGRNGHVVEKQLTIEVKEP
jgi:hypothetical protein